MLRASRRPLLVREPPVVVRSSDVCRGFVGKACRQRLFAPSGRVVGRCGHHNLQATCVSMRSLCGPHNLQATCVSLVQAQRDWRESARPLGNLVPRMLSWRSQNSGDPLPTLSEAEEKELRQLFDQWDGNGDGSIDAAELLAAMRAMGRDPTDEEVKHKIAAVDKGRSGTIEFSEFCQMISAKLPRSDTAPSASQMTGATGSAWTREHALGAVERACAINGNWSFCVIDPNDPHSRWFSLFREIRRGPGLIALVCAPNGRDQVQTQARASGVQATGGALNEMIEIGVLNVQHARDKGGQNARKLVLGSPVVVHLEFSSSTASRSIFWDTVFVTVVNVLLEVISGSRRGPRLEHGLVQEGVLNAEANLSQAHGFLREEDSDFFYVEIPRSSENAVFSYDDDDFAKHLGQTHPDPDMPYGGHYLKVRKDRVAAHSAFRTALITDPLDQLRWHLAMVWPAPISLSDIVFLERGSQLAPNMDKAYGVSRLISGDIVVKIHGRRIPVLDAR